MTHGRIKWKGQLRAVLPDRPQTPISFSESFLFVYLNRIPKQTPKNEPQQKTLNQKKTVINKVAIVSKLPFLDNRRIWIYTQ